MGEACLLSTATHRVGSEETACQYRAVTLPVEATGGGHLREQKGDRDAHSRRDAVVGFSLAGE